MPKPKEVLLKVNKRPIALAMHVFNHIDFDIYFNHMYCMREWSQKYDLIVMGKKGLDAATAREAMMNRAIENNCSHIIFLDGDHLVPKDMIDILWQSKGDAMVSGLVCKKGEDMQQVGWGTTTDGRYIDLDLPLTGQTYEVGVCAFGCTMINVDKAKKLVKPIFRDTCTLDANGNLTNIRSDVNICNAFREAGERVMIDTRILVGHHGISIPVYPQNAENLTQLLRMNQNDIQLRVGQTGDYYE